MLCWTFRSESDILKFRICLKRYEIFLKNAKIGTATTQFPCFELQRVRILFLLLRSIHGQRSNDPVLLFPLLTNPQHEKWKLRSSRRSSRIEKDNCNAGPINRPIKPKFWTSELQVGNLTVRLMVKFWSPPMIIFRIFIEYSEYFFYLIRCV